MNQLQKSFCDGAAMAYRDIANQIRVMIDKAPPEVKEFVQYLSPLADANEAKAVEVYKECERYEAHLKGKSNG